MQFRLIPAALLAVGLLGFSASGLYSAEPAAPAEDHTAEFKVLTQDFINLEALFAKYADPVHKVPMSGHISLLKRRGVLLGWTPPEGMLIGGGGGRGAQGAGYGGRGGGPENKIQYDSVKYDELRYDINQMYQRIANYLAPLRTPLPTPPNELVINPVDVHPNPANPADVKAALDILDREIKRMERAVAMKQGSAIPEVEESRISRVKQRREQLAKQFTKARWDELVADLKADY
jgi:hypothetical protein